MAAGQPISLLRMREYDRQSQLADGMFKTHDPEEASRIARSLDVDFVYVDQVERQAFGDAAAEKFRDTGSSTKPSPAVQRPSTRSADREPQPSLCLQSASSGPVWPVSPSDISSRAAATRSRSSNGTRSSADSDGPFITGTFISTSARIGSIPRTRGWRVHPRDPRRRGDRDSAKERRPHVRQVSRVAAAAEHPCGDADQADGDRRARPRPSRAPRRRVVRSRRRQQVHDRTLYNIFFEPYTRKFLFHSPSELHRDWARAGVNRAVIDKRARADNLWSLLMNTLMPKPVETMFLYPPTGRRPILGSTRRKHRRRRRPDRPGSGCHRHRDDRPPGHRSRNRDRTHPVRISSGPVLLPR